MVVIGLYGSKMTAYKHRARLDEIREAISSMRAEVSRRNADLDLQMRERAVELNMTVEEYKEYLMSLIAK